MDAPAVQVCKCCEHPAHCGLKCPTPLSVTYSCFSKKSREKDDCVCVHCRCPECLKTLSPEIRKFYEEPDESEMP